MNIREYVDIKNYSTLHMGGQFRYFTVISSIQDLLSAYAITQNDANYKNTPIFVLGGGSNIVFSDGILNVLVLKIEIKSFEIISETNEYVDIKIGAGEIWDEIVSRTVDMGLSGFESLSAIPGTVGATPVQNVGAYGAEVKDTILEVEVFDIKNGTISRILNKDCKFGYRDSIFKNEAKGRYIITAVIFKLKKTDDKNSLLQKREEITKTRWSKLPNPKEIPNVGSFFKNPIVENVVANKIKNNFPDAKFYPLDYNLTKIPAGWLIEQAGLKGKSFGKVSIYDKNALVLVNNGDATKEDIIKTRNEIIKIVKEKFGITLEQEPEIV